MSKKNSTPGVKFSGYIRIPKAFFGDARYRDALSPEAKLLYGLLADRASLSQKMGEQWRDGQNNPFVYFSIDEAQERFQCCRDTAAKYMKQLESAGLIRRTRHRNTYRIVVLRSEELFDRDTTAENSPHQGRENPDTCADFVGTNKPERNNPEQNNPDTTSNRQELLEQIKKNISYDALVTLRSREQVDGIVEVIADVLSSGAPVRIAGQEISAGRVRERFLALDDMDICYVLDSIQREEKTIRNLRGYILARLYEAKNMEEFFYENWTKSDEYHEEKKQG